MQHHAQAQKPRRRAQTFGRGGALAALGQVGIADRRSAQQPYDEVRPACVRTQGDRQKRRGEAGLSGRRSGRSRWRGRFSRAGSISMATAKRTAAPIAASNVRFFSILKSYRYWASYLGRSDLVAGSLGGKTPPGGPRRYGGLHRRSAVSSRSASRVDARGPFQFEDSWELRWVRSLAQRGTSWGMSGDHGATQEDIQRE